MICRTVKSRTDAATWRGSKARHDRQRRLWITVDE